MLDLSSTNIKPVAALLITGYLLLTAVRNIEQILSSIVHILFLYLLPQWTYFDFYSVIPRLLILCFYAVLVFKYLPGFNGQIFLANLPKRFTSRLIGGTVSLVLISYALIFIVSEASFKLRNSYHVDSDLLAIKGVTISVLGLIEMVIVLIGIIKLTKSQPSIS